MSSKLSPIYPQKRDFILLLTRQNHSYIMASTQMFSNLITSRR